MPLSMVSGDLPGSWISAPVTSPAITMTNASTASQMTTTMNFASKMLPRRLRRVQWSHWQGLNRLPSRQQSPLGGRGIARR